MNFIYVFYHLLIFMVNSVHHNSILFAIHSKTSISGCHSNVCGYVLALVVRLLGIKDGIHQGVCNDL